MGEQGVLLLIVECKCAGNAGVRRSSFCSHYREDYIRWEHQLKLNPKENVLCGTITIKRRNQATPWLDNQNEHHQCGTDEHRVALDIIAGEETTSPSSILAENA